MDNPFLLAFSFSAFGLLLLLVNTILFFTTKKHFEGDKLYSALIIYLTIYFSIELACNIVGFIEPNSNIFISHFAFNIQHLLLSIFFYRLFDEKYLKRLVALLFVIFIVSNTVYYINNPSSFFKFNLFEIAYISFITIAFTLIHLYQSLDKEKKYFYFTLGVSGYMLTSCLIFISGNIELVFLEEPYIDIWVFNSLFFMVYQFFLFKEWRFLNSLKRNG